MITSEVTSEVMVADHIALDLHPAAGSALETAEILDGLEVPEQFDFKKVVHILAGTTVSGQTLSTGCISASTAMGEAQIPRWHAGIRPIRIARLLVSGSIRRPTTRLRFSPLMHPP